MSLFSRVFQIIRANFQFGSAPDMPAPDSFYQEFQQKQKGKAQNQTSNSHARGQGEHSSQSTGANVPFDPKLAEYYTNLEVPYGSDLKTVQKAWKTLVRKYHPDLYENDPPKKRIANDLVQRLNHAYQELEKRLKKES